MGNADQSNGHDVSKARQKKYHRRSPWACDECRLRKRKCDGTQPCNGCKAIDHQCSYAFRGKAIPAASHRLRLLEERLRTARNFLEELKTRGSADGKAEIDSVLHAMDYPFPEVFERKVHESEDSARPLKLDSMMSNDGQLIIHGPLATSFYGASSGFYFVWRTLGLFLINHPNNISPTITRAVIAELFNVPFPSMETLGMTSTGVHVLPSRETTFGLLNGLFSKCHPLLQFLRRTDFTQMVEQIYREPRLRFGGSDHSFMPLLHSALGLGYLFQIQHHRVQGCHVAIREATKHFFIARNSFDITQCNDLVSLQTLMCFIVFLISTSRLAAAHTYIGIACSSALRLGLHAKSDLDSDQRQTRGRIFAAVVKVDIFASLVLGLPAFISVQDIDQDTVLSPSPMPTSPADEDNNSAIEALQSIASAKHLELLKLTAVGHKTIFLTSFSSGEIPLTGNTVGIDIWKLEDVEADFRAWAKGVSLLLTRMGEFEGLTIARYDLEMAYYFGQLILYIPFLHYLTKMADGSAISRHQSQHALACIKIASTTITRSEIMLNQGGLFPASWMSIYTIFLSVVCLIFLVAAHKGTSKPGEAWRKGEVGIRLLAAAACVDDGATRCLRILRMLVQQLSHTVDFDIDQIEASTIRVCQSSPNHPRPHHHLPPLAQQHHQQHATDETPSPSSSTLTGSHRFSSAIAAAASSENAPYRPSPTNLPILPMPWLAVVGNDTVETPPSNQFESMLSGYSEPGVGVRTETGGRLPDAGQTSLDADMIFAQAQESNLVGGIDIFNSSGGGEEVS